MSIDLPFWAALGRAARSWGLAALTLTIAAVAAANWAATSFPSPNGLGSDDIITGSVAPRPRERTTRIIRSVLSDAPIVIHQ